MPCSAVILIGSVKWSWKFWNFGKVYICNEDTLYRKPPQPLKKNPRLYTHQNMKYAKFWTKWLKHSVRRSVNVYINNCCTPRYWKLPSMLYTRGHWIPASLLAKRAFKDYNAGLKLWNSAIIFSGKIICS